MRTEALIKAQKKYYDKMKTNEAYKEKRNENMRNYYNRKKEEPEYREKVNQKALNYYYTNRERILAKKKEDYRNKKT